MAAEESDLQFIRCPGCRSLVPAVATRCRMCGQLLEPRKRDQADSANKKSRVRQRTMSVSEDERESLRDRIATGEFSEEAEGAEFNEDDFPVEAEPFDDLPADVRPFAERHEPEEPEEVPSFLHAPEAPPEPRHEVSQREAKVDSDWLHEDAVSEDDRDDDVGDEDLGDDDDASDDGDLPELQAPTKKRRRRRRKKKGNQVAGQSPETQTEELGTLDPLDLPNSSDYPDALERTSPKVVVGQRPQPVAQGHGMPWSRPEAIESPRPPAPERVRPDYTERRMERQPAPPVMAQTPAPQRSEPARREPQREDYLSRGEERRAPAPRQDRSRQAEPVEAGAGELVGWLVFAGGSGDLTSHELRGGQFFVSRERLRPQDFVFDDPTVSKPQCLIFANEQNGVMVQDLMSEHGTYIRRQGSEHFEREQGQFAVDHGDTLRFGEVEVMLCLMPRAF